MKVQTAVLLLCFLSGVFLSVVQSKPSPALMRELVALEKYLEKKEGSEGTDGQSETDEKLTKNNEQEEEKNPAENEKDKPKNENNNNGETNNAEGLGPEVGATKIPTEQEAFVPPAKPEEDVPPENTEGSAPSDNGAEAPNEEGVSSANGEEIYELLDEVTGKIKDALDKLSSLGEDIRKQFQQDDRKITELEDNIKKAKEKTNGNIDQLKIILEEIIKSINGQDETSSVGKQSVQENAPARRSHISDTEFLNMLHSLLAYS